MKRYTPLLLAVLVAGCCAPKRQSNTQRMSVPEIIALRQWDEQRAGDYTNAIADATLLIHMKYRVEEMLRKRHDCKHNIGDFTGAKADANELLHYRKLAP